MILKLDIAKRHLLFCGLAIILSALLSSNANAQGFNVNLGSSTVDVSSGSGIVSTSLLVSIENPTANDLDIAGYSFLFDVAPIGGGLPAGVSFDTTNGTNDAVTYISGAGNQPLPFAGQTPPAATINLSPGAGDIGLGQIQFANGTVSAGAEFDLLMVNLLVDRSAAVLGDYSITLNQNGQNTVNTANGAEQEFGFTAGTLRIVSAPAVPEPSSWVVLGLLQTALMLRRRRS